MKTYWETGNYSQPTTAELRSKSAASIKKEAKKGNVYEPVIIQSRKIAKKWWGIAWCDNLERYADYENRIDRGKRYVRTGAVVDLKIQKGKILARVQGTRRIPYKIEIRISPLSEERIQNIIEKCGRKIQNMEQLMLGNIPEELQELFREKGGLFPAPNEISFDCSCPDWAIMCKHVAAALYGVGARLDEEPLLFFELRGIDPNKFISIALQNKVEEMLANENKPSPRIIPDAETLSLFGI